MIGIIEHKNQISGQPPPSPCLYGDKEAAFITFSNGKEPHLLSQDKMTLLSDLTSSYKLLEATPEVKHDSLMKNQETKSLSTDNSTRGLPDEK